MLPRKAKRAAGLPVQKEDSQQPSLARQWQSLHSFTLSPPFSLVSCFVVQLIRDAQSIAAEALGPQGTCSVGEVALELQRRGYSVVVRRITDSRKYWTKSMTSTFICCVDESTGWPVEYIIDPNFKALFQCGYMTEHYLYFWDSLPQVFVGMPCQLLPSVQLVCEEMALSFLEAGRPVPPWRSQSATLSRWMSDVFTELPVSQP